MCRSEHIRPFPRPVRPRLKTEGKLRMSSYDVVVIGGGPAGIVTGLTAKKRNPEKSFLMIQKHSRGLVPCGIPYVFGALDDIAQNEMGPGPFKAAGGEVLVDTVTDLDVEAKTLSTEGGRQISYGSLVLATGSEPLIPTFLKGYDLEGVEYVRKDFEYIDGLKRRAADADSIAIIGAGFIGCEVAEQLALDGKREVHLIEAEKHCLSRAFSADFAAMADEAMRGAGVHVYTGTKAMEIRGEVGRASELVLEGGETLDVDMVISAIGYTPNTDLARKAGLRINQHGAIAKDNYMRTSAPGVYAVGDCSSTRGFITGRADSIMLASTGTAEARVLGHNLFGIGMLNTFSGTLSVFSTELGGRTFASAGAIEQTAQEANVKYVVGRFKAMDRHPGALPGASEVEIKLIVSPENGEIVGGEIVGGKAVGEMINIVSLAIQKAVTVYEMVSFQMGTHPLLTPAPTKYVLVKACEDAISKICSQRS